MSDKKYNVEPLDPREHDRVAFSCGSTDLDQYLQKQAKQDAERGISVTYVLCGSNRNTILGYYSISTASIETKQLPEDFKRKIPRYEALPAMLIGRLAVDSRYQRQGLGAHLLISALKRSLRISKEIGSIAVIVHAKDEQAAQFYKHYGFRCFADKLLHLFMPMLEIEKINT